MIENKRLNVSYILFVSLQNGDILWKSQFDIIHDMSFNHNGKYLCVFEKPKNCVFAYMHILNVTRLQWICEIRLTYDGILPALGWDAFIWANDNLMFIAPDDIHISGVNDLNKRMSQKNNGVNENKRVFTAPLDISDYVKSNENKRICILSLDKKWYDVQPRVMRCLKDIFNDNNICELILEYGGLYWAIIMFKYPNIDSNNNARIAMSEVFESGECEDCNILLMAKHIRDMKQFKFSKWNFDVCFVPNTFNDIWKHQMIQKAVIGNIAQ